MTRQPFVWGILVFVLCINRLEGKKYATDPANMPPAPCLDIDLNETENSGMRRVASFVAQGSGQQIGRNGPEHSQFEFTADAGKPVRIRISSSNAEGNV